MVKEELIDWNEYTCGANGEMYSHFTKKYLKGNTHNKGYIQVKLKCIDGKQREFMWHRVIYTYFYGTIPEGMQINHINEDKTDNRLCNLELVTPSQNINHATRNERAAAKLRGIPRPYMIEQNKNKSKPVVAVDKEGNAVYEFPSIAEAGKNGFYHSWDCCIGKRKTCGGYGWMFLEDWLKIKGDI